MTDRRLNTCAILLLVIVLSLWHRAYASPVQLAIVVGISDYPTSSDLWPLNFAHRDAIKVADALEQRGYTVILLLDANAKKRSIENALKDAGAFFDQGTDTGSVIFFFAGHGFSSNGNDWLIPEDGVASDPAETGISLAEVQELLIASGANQRILFIDACRENTSSTRGFSRVFEDVQLPEAGGTAISFSTKQGATSAEVTALQQGIYSYFLTRGLLGATGEEELTFSSLHNYISKNVRKYTAETGLKIQIPFRAGENFGDFFIGSTDRDSSDSIFLEREVEQFVDSMKNKNLKQMTAIAKLSSSTVELLQNVFAHYEKITIGQPPSFSYNVDSVQIQVEIDHLVDQNGTQVIPSTKWRSLSIRSDKNAQGWSRLYE